MRPIRKRWIRPQTPAPFRHQPLSRALIAAGVALASGLLLHPHLALVVLPASAALILIGGARSRQQQKREGVAAPLFSLSRTKGLRAKRQRRL